MAPEVIRQRRHRVVMYFNRRLHIIRNTILSLSENVNHIRSQPSLLLLIPVAIIALKVLML